MIFTWLYSPRYENVNVNLVVADILRMTKMKTEMMKIWKIHGV